MTFNSSCSFAGVANMLEPFGINKEDYEIAIGMNIPYLFKYDEQRKTYQTGISLQDNSLFNHYLNTLGINLEGRFLMKNDAIQILDSSNTLTMIGILLDSGNKHAVIYLGKRDNQYVFLNNRNQNSDEPNEYVFNKNELYIRIDEPAAVGWLVSCSEKRANWESEYNESLSVLQKYKNELRDFCEIRQTFEEIESARERLFRPLLLDGLTMMQLIKNEKMYILLKNMQSKYLNIIKKQCSVTLKDELPFELFDEVFTEYIKLINKQLGLQND